MIKIQAAQETCVMTFAKQRLAPRGIRRTIACAEVAARVGQIVGVAIFVALLFLLPPARAQQSSEATPAGNVQNGKKLFVADGCYECHGYLGQGAAQTGAARIGPPMLSYDGFQSYVRKPANQMPPYTSKALPDQDLADIYAYLKSIPVPPKGKDIPLLNK
jgi:ubiquinol-cytochrome c reductase cytochrome c subunit